MNTNNESHDAVQQHIRALWQNGELAQAEQLAKAHLAQYEQEKNLTGAIAMRLELAIIADLKGHSQSAIEQFKQIQAFLPQNDKRQEASLYNNLGRAYFNLGDYQQALACYSKSLSIYELLAETRGIAIASFNIGQVHEKLANYETALQYVLKSIQLYEALDHKQGLSVAYLSLGNIQDSLQDFNAALESYTKSMGYAHAIGDVWNEHSAKLNCANTYQRLGLFREAEQLYRALMQQAEEQELSESKRAYVVNGLANLYFSEGRYQEAMQLAKESQEIWCRYSNKYAQAMNYLLLGKTWASMQEGD